MKKILAFLFLGSALFGANIPSAFNIPKNTEIKKLEKSAIVVEYNKNSSNAQITLEVPIDIESFPDGVKADFTNILRVKCFLTGPVDKAYSQTKIVTNGKKTLYFRFSGIPEADLLKLRQYICNVDFKSKNGRFYGINTRHPSIASIVEEASLLHSGGL